MAPGASVIALAHTLLAIAFHVILAATMTCASLLNKRQRITLFSPIVKRPFRTLSAPACFAWEGHTPPSPPTPRQPRHGMVE
jgi:hypothetical protein